MPNAIPACSHRPACDACPRYGAQDIAPGAAQSLAALAREHGLPEVPVIPSAPRGFRHRARLAIRGRLGSPKIGLFETDSHHVVHIPNCQVHHPLINTVAAVVRSALVDARVSCYSDRAHLGLARYLQVVVERGSQTAQVVLVANAESAAPLRECLNLIRERLGEKLHSLWVNFNTQPNNVILGPDFECHAGPAALIESFGTAAIHYPPGAFGQSNLPVAEQLVRFVRDQTAAETRVVEFYAGVGALGLSIVDKARHLTLNEAAPASLAGLDMGVADLPAPLRERVMVRPGLAGAAADAVHGADMVIVDPPRKGLDAGLIAALCADPPPGLLYISCGLASLLSDLRLLLAAGTVQLTRLTAFNLMPYTAHVECVARLERR